MNQFMQYRDSKLMKLPMESFQVPQDQIVNDDAKGTGSTQSVDSCQPKVAIASSSSQVEGFVPDVRLDEIWEEYNQALNSKTNESQAIKTTQKMKVQDTLKNVEQNSKTMKVPEKILYDKDI